MSELAHRGLEISVANGGMTPEKADELKKSWEDPSDTAAWKNYVDEPLVDDSPLLSVPWELRHPAIPGTEEQWRKIGAAARRVGDPLNDNYIIGY